MNFRISKFTLNNNKYESKEGTHILVGKRNFPIRVPVHFVTNDDDGNIITEQCALNSTFVFPVISREGYAFSGWFYDADFTNEVSEDDLVTGSEITVYAKWEERAEIRITSTAVIDGYDMQTYTLFSDEEYTLTQLQGAKYTATFYGNGVLNQGTVEGLTIRNSPNTVCVQFIYKDDVYYKAIELQLTKSSGNVVALITRRCYWLQSNSYYAPGMYIDDIKNGVSTNSTTSSYNLKNITISIPSNPSVMPYLRSNSSGEGAIRLDFPLQTDDEFDMTFRLNDGGNGHIFGTYAGNDTQDIRLFVNSFGDAKCDYGQYRTTIVPYDYDMISRFHDYHYKNGEFRRLDDNHVVTWTPSSNSINTTNCTIFGTYNNASLMGSKCDIAKFAVIRDGQKLVDLVAYNDNGSPCFKDLISGKLYGVTKGQLFYIEHAL